MIIKPKVRGFICTTAHPEGCAANVKEQIKYIRDKGAISGAPKNVLVIGCSNGYGLASRITAAFGGGANTLGVCFEKPPTDKRTASAGYYNTAAFQKLARAEGLYAETVNGDAFSSECKQKTLDLLKQNMGKVDLVVYSLGAPRRQDPVTGELYTSALKPINKGYTAKNLNTDTLTITDITVEPASEEEIRNTIKVMGGEDWELWIKALKNADALADGCKTVAYTYLGDKLTWPIYGHATIGKAKEDLDRAARALNKELAPVNGSANVAVLKALVTQSSSAIPIMPLYISLLYRVMKEEGTHEGCIQQLYRLFTEGLYSDNPRVDDNTRLRMDNLELTPEVQGRVEELWPQVTEENLFQITDYKSYNDDFLRLFGFGWEGVDYEADVSPMVDAEFH